MPRDPGPDNPTQTTTVSAGEEQPAIKAEQQQPVTTDQQGWKFMSYSYCQELSQQACWLLIDCSSKLTVLLTMTTTHKFPLQAVRSEQEPMEEEEEDLGEEEEEDGWPMDRSFSPVTISLLIHFNFFVHLLSLAGTSIPVQHRK